MAAFLENTAAHRILGQLYLLEKDKQSALAPYKKLVEFNPMFSKKLYKSVYADMLISAVEK